MWLLGQGFLPILDNDRKPISKVCKKFIESNWEHIVPQLMSWQTKSIDFSTFELVWDEQDRKFKAKQSTSVAYLLQLLYESWEKLSSVYLKFLVGRMPRMFR